MMSLSVPPWMSSSRDDPVKFAISRDPSKIEYCKTLTAPSHIGPKELALFMLEAHAGGGAVVVEVALSKLWEEREDFIPCGLIQGFPALFARVEALRRQPSA